MPPPHSSRSRFCRLVRGIDAVGRVWAPPSFIGYRPSPLFPCPEQPRRIRVVSDQPDDLNLRGEAWRVNFDAVRGLAVDSTLPRPSPGTPPRPLSRNPLLKAPVNVWGDRSVRATRRFAEAFGDPSSPVIRKSPRLSLGDGGLRGPSLPGAGHAGGRGRVRPRGRTPACPPIPLPNVNPRLPAGGF